MEEIVNKGSIIRPTSQSYLDQINGKSIVSSKNIEKYLKDNYNLTLPEYYNLVNFGDKDLYPKCSNPDCHNKCSFIRLSVGYQKYCCKECYNKVTLQILNKKPWSEKRRNDRSILTKSIQDKKVLEGTHNFLNQSNDHKINAQLESSKSTFINRVKLRNINKAYFYIGLIDKNNFKIGITFVGVYERGYHLRLISCHKLIEDTPEYIANLEYSIKKKFLDKHTLSLESFNVKSLKEILDYIRNY